MGEIVEVQNPLTFRVVYDEELDFLYANIPVKIPPGALRKIVALTGDPWRYLEDRGLVLILSAWASESDVDVQAIGKALEVKYKELLGEIKKIVEGTAVEEGKAEKKKKKKMRKAKRRRKRGGVKTKAKKKGRRGRKQLKGKR